MGREARERAARPRTDSVQDLSDEIARLAQAYRDQSLRKPGSQHSLSLHRFLGDTVRRSIESRWREDPGPEPVLGPRVKWSRATVTYLDRATVPGID